MTKKQKTKELEPQAGEVQKDWAGESAVGQEVQSLVDELAKAREEVTACNDKMLRLAAEFENTKKRLQRERETALKYAEENVLKELLPGIDNLERAMDQGRETANLAGLLEGVSLTRDGLLGALEKFGVKPIVSVGELFDPNLHDALGMEPSDQVAENVVLKEFQKGYIYKERLLRAAKVIVSQGAVAPNSSNNVA